MKTLEQVKEVIETAIAGDMALNLPPKLVLAIVDECLAGRYMRENLGLECSLKFSILLDELKKHEHVEKFDTARTRTDSVLEGEG